MNKSQHLKDDWLVSHARPIISYRAVFGNMAHTTRCGRVFEDHNEDDVKNMFLHQIEKAEHRFVIKFLDLKGFGSKAIYTALTAILSAAADLLPQIKKCPARSNRGQRVLFSSWGGSQRFPERISISNGIYDCATLQSIEIHN
jgi:hypothetical protein